MYSISLPVFLLISKHQKTSMYLGQWNRNNVPVGNYFGLDCTSSGYVTNKTGSSWSSTDRVISMLVGMIVPVKGLRRYVEGNRFTENWVTEWLVAEHLRLGRPRYRKRKQNSFQHHGGKCKSPSKFAWKREWVEEMESMGVIKNGMKMLQTKWDDAWCTAVSFSVLYSRILF